MFLRWNCVLTGRDVVSKELSIVQDGRSKGMVWLIPLCVLPEPLGTISIEAEGKKAEINTGSVWGHSVCPANPLPVSWAWKWGGQGWGRWNCLGLGSREEEMVAVPWTAKGSSSSTRGAERRERFWETEVSSEKHLQLKVYRNPSIFGWWRKGREAVVRSNSDVGRGDCQGL